MDKKWDICTIKGARASNCDYALYEESVGACIADGMGSSPLGDAVARCVCHIALGSMKAGATPICAIRDACFYARRLIGDLNLTGSGAALTLVKLSRGCFEAAWVGDVAFLIINDRNVRLSNLESLDTCGNKITRGVGLRNEEPHFLETSICKDDRIVVCTDGVWRELGVDALTEFVATSSTPQEAAANLVLGRAACDNATALVVFGAVD